MDWMAQEQERGITITSAATTAFWRDYPDQHYRYARARGLYGRGGAQPARPRRRRRRLRLGRRRSAAVRDGLAAGRQVQGPADRVHQQDGPHRRELLRRRAVDARAPRRQPGAGADPDRPGGRLPRRHRPRRDAGDRLQGRPRPGARDRRDPRRARRAGARVPPPADRHDLALRRRGARGVHRGRELGHARPDQARAARRHAVGRDHAGAARLRLQEQGRAAAARRRDRLPAEPARRAAGDGHRPEDAGGGRARAEARRAVLGARLQGHVRSVRRQAHVLPRLQRQARRPATACSTRRTGKTERIGRILQMHANSREEREEIGAGEIAAGVGLKDDDDRRHALGRERSRSCSSR